jgi:subtilisin family serine protease
MATPHIAGLAAYLLSGSGKVTPAALKTTIQSLATTNVVKFTANARSAGTPNYLSFNGWTG